LTKIQEKMVKNNKLEVDKRFPLIKKENEGFTM